FGAYIRVPNYVLHAMRADGTDIQPLSYYETSEWNPSVDNHGMIVYSRWDYTDRENCLGSNFWLCYPDGRNPRAPHGNYPYPWHTFPEPPPNLAAHTAADTRRGRPMTELGIRAIPASRRYILTAAPHHGEAFGSLCILDLSVPDDGHMSQLRRITPYVPFPESETGARSQYRFGTPWPLSEDVYLCNSWENLYLLDRFGNLELLCERELLPCEPDDRLRLTDPIPLRPRPRPPVLPGQTTATGGGGAPARISVMDVRHTDIPLPPGVLVRHLRLLQTFLKPNHPMGQPLGGYQNENVPRMSLGTVPVAADGSVSFLAPPGKELMFQLLDENHMAIHAMRSVAYVHPGEHLLCLGCHENPHDTARHRAKGPALAVSGPPVVPEPEVGPLEPVSYYRHIRPLSESVCLPCHRRQGSGPVDMDYEALRPLAFHFAGGMAWTTVQRLHGGSRTIPGSFGARACRLGRAVLKHRREGRIPESAYRTVVLWLDANSPRLTALHREGDQLAGTLVWPKLDVDPLDPLGLEGSPGENTPARIAARAALWHPAGPERLLGHGHRFLVSDHSSDRVLLVDRDGAVLWQVGCDHPQDVWWLDGRVLVAWRHAAQVIEPDLGTGRGGRVIWEYRTESPNEIPCCQPLADGRVLVGVCGPCELVEVGPDGTVAARIPLPKPSGEIHSQFRFCRKTPEGTYLVPFLSARFVGEYDADGRECRRFEWPGAVVSAERLPDGNTLLGGGDLVREVDREGKVVWELDSEDLGDARFQTVAGIRRLANGNTLITNWGVRGNDRERPRILEVSPQKWILWREWENPALGLTAQTQLLDAPIEPPR
ncbi:MAG: hypothetical protein JXR77_11195, partial [Lentisphaeria bacterium]|nr:hypothetical protein [Lentisphaeria bacterium]